MKLREKFNLVVLAADKDIEHTLRGVLDPPCQLRLGTMTYEAIVHPKHDPGVLKQASETVRPFLRRADYAIAVFDRDGCGSMAQREDLEERVERLLTANGWQNRCAAIAIDPELENWVGICLGSQVAQAVIGWPHRGKDLRDHYREQGASQPGIRQIKRPKEVFRQALRFASVQWSAALYFELATKAPIAQCVDPAFLKLRATLVRWFPA